MEVVFQKNIRRQESVRQIDRMTILDLLVIKVEPGSQEGEHLQKDPEQPLCCRQEQGITPRTSYSRLPEKQKRYYVQRRKDQTQREH